MPRSSPSTGLPLVTQATSAATTPSTTPLPSPIAASLSSALRALAHDSSPSASPRTMTVSVWVAALPPMPATIGMKTASAVAWLIVPSNAATTDAATKAVTRLMPSHGRRLRSASNGRGLDPLVARHAGQAVEVLGRLVLQDVDHVVDRDDAGQLVLLVDDRNRQQVVGGHQPGRFLLVGVDPHAEDVGRHDPLERRLGRHQQQPAQRRHADQVPAGVDDVEIEDHLDVDARSGARRSPRPPSGLR